MYVAIEGIDTSGKSTQIGLLKNAFKDAVFVKEPGETALGKSVREIVLNQKIDSEIAKLFLFLADRAELYDAVLSKNIDKLIISDRSCISGIAYAESDDLIFLAKLNRMALNGFVPQKCVLLKLTEEELKYRLSQKAHDEIEKKGINYLLYTQERLEKAAKALGAELLVVDASHPKEAILADIKDFILS